LHGRTQTNHKGVSNLAVGTVERRLLAPVRAAEKKDRMSAKFIAPLAERKPPEIFCRSFIMRPSRSA
jgi:hypothetical protein